MSIVVKTAPSALAATPTGGTDRTLAFYRNPAVDVQRFLFVEEATSMASRTTTELQLTPSKTVVAGAVLPKTSLSTGRLVHQGVATSSIDSQQYPVKVNISLTYDEYYLTSGQAAVVLEQALQLAINSAIRSALLTKIFPSV